MNITEVIQRHSDLHSEEIALVDRVGRMDRKISFREFEDSIGKMATLLRESGLRPGDTVLIFHSMSAELYIALGAVLRGGMTAMFVDPSAGRHHINRCCEFLPPQALIASSKAHLLRFLSPAVRQIPIKWSIGGRVPFTDCIEQYRHLEHDQNIHACEPDTPALASFTSGSTGEPKVVIRRHGFLLSQYRAIDEHLSLTPGEVELVTMPIFVLANLASRVTSVIADADLRRVAEIVPEPVIRQMQKHQVGRITASPAFLDRMVNHCERTGMQLSSLRKIFTGGGPVSPQLLCRLQSVAPDAEITAVYGSTEAEPISTLATDQMDAKDAAAVSGGRGLLVGMPVRSLEVRVMRDDWGQSIGRISAQDFVERCCETEQPGEIVVSGDHVLDAYLSKKSEDENKFQVNGTRWHRTGDAGYFDKRGRLWLLGRCSARLEDPRGPLYPLGVEQAAMLHSNIRNAALISHRKKRVLAVTLHDPKMQFDTPELLNKLSFASIDSIRILDRMPVDRRHQSKIDYLALRELLEQ